VLRTLVETELAARDASNVVNRLKAAGFPVTKTLDSFDVAGSSIQPKVFDYLSSLDGFALSARTWGRSSSPRRIAGVTWPVRSFGSTDPVILPLTALRARSRHLRLPKYAILRPGGPSYR
jgi:hypothetical protein